jgi:hypothetical protein
MAKQNNATQSKVKRINRMQAANQVLAQVNGKTTSAELAKLADQLVVDAGGKSNPLMALRTIRRNLEVAEALGILKLTRPTDIIVERIKSK